MTISITCSGCGRSFTLKDELAGKRATCKCGEKIQIPVAEEGDYNLEPLVRDEDPLGAAVEEEADPLSLAPLESKTQTASLAGNSAMPGAPEPGRPKKKKSTEKKLKPVHIVAIVGASLFFVLTLAVVLVIVVLVRSQPGFKSPEDAFAAHQQALRVRDWEAQFEALTPNSREMLLQFLVFTAIQTSSNDDEVRRLFARHDMEDLLIGPNETESDIDHVSELREPLDSIGDDAKFYDNLYEALLNAAEDRITNSQMRMLHRKQRGAARRALATATLNDDLEIDGERARATMHVEVEEDLEVDVPIRFQRIEGRWYVDIEESVGGSLPAMFF